MFCVVGKTAMRKIALRKKAAEQGRKYFRWTCRACGGPQDFYVSNGSCAKCARSRALDYHEQIRRIIGRVANG